MSMIEQPALNGVYIIELCSGERRRWQYGGADDRSQVWWRDLETGREFSETSLMYTWWIVRRQDMPLQPISERSQ